MRRAHITLTMIVTAVVIGALVIPLAPLAPPAHAQFISLSERQEIQLGRQVEAQLAKKPGFVDDPALTHHVTEIGLRLAQVSERPHLPWTYHVVRDPSVNAFAVLGGYIFVTRPLLRFVKSEDELAFVLGHETTHIAHRHAVDLVQKDMQLQFGALLITQLLFNGSFPAYAATQVARNLIDAKYSREKRV